MSPWVSILLAVLATLVMVYELKEKGRLRESLNIVRSVRPIMILTNLPVLAATAVAAMLLKASTPLMRWSWFSYLSSEGTNMNLIGLKIVWFAPFFAVLLIFMPLVARAEERLFREGTKNWGCGMGRSIVFGLMHIISGIPLSYALALAIPGLWYTYQYFRGGVRHSTAYHTAWNLTLVLIGLLIGLAAMFS